LKIYLEYNDEGGPGIFLTRLAKEFNKLGVMAKKIKDADIFIVTGGESIKIIKEAKERKTKILYRADGLHYERVLFGSKIINYYRNRYQRWLLKNSDGVIYQSNFSKEQFERFLWAKEGAIIFNGIDANSWNFRASKPVPGQQVRMLSSHHFRPHKRLQESVRVLAHMIEEGIDAVIFVVGDDNLDTFSHCKSLALELGVDSRIKWFGKLPVSNLGEVYSQCHLMICPSWIDPCPNVVIEALATGLPIICSSTGGVPELVRDAGVIVEEEFKLEYLSYNNFNKIPRVNVKQYIEGIKKTLSNWEQISNTGRYYAETDYSIKTVAQKYIKACQRVI